MSTNTEVRYWLLALAVAAFLTIAIVLLCAGCTLLKYEDSLGHTKKATMPAGLRYYRAGLADGSTLLLAVDKDGRVWRCTSAGMTPYEGTFVGKKGETP